tara:strand:- start:3289 stop:4281 length:993 start_codon:yes stop_codon:yes gene_type:complete
MIDETHKTLLDLYKQMFRIRRVEETISEKYSEQEMRCPMHLSIGQESVAVGVCHSLETDDVVFSNHRAHAHYLAKGGSLNELISELYGKQSGCSGGRGGSMHLISKDVGFHGSTPIVGGTVPIAVGAAWSFKLQNNNNISVVFLGDGCFEEGVIHESLNFAALYKLPVLFVLENNLYSVYTPLSERQPNREITDIVSAHGINAVKADGMDILSVKECADSSINKIKSGDGPQFIEFSVYRWMEHCGPNDDDNLGYRPKGELNNWKKRCPIENARKKLEKISNKERNSIIFDEKYNEEILNKINEEIKEAFEFAKNSSFPDKSSLSDYIYA